MPTNPQQLHDSMVRIGRSLAAVGQSIQAARTEALRTLKEAVAAPVAVVARVQETAASDLTLRCAIPLEEDISVGIPCPQGLRTPPLLAVDGSQCLADRHDEQVFAVINIGSVKIKEGSGRAPEVLTDTHVLFGDELQTADGDLLTEGDVALMRDSAEGRSMLTDAPAASGAIVLRDGPLELWGEKDASSPGAFKQTLSRYLVDLGELRRRGCIVAGYVDKPAADLVIRMLELTLSRQASSQRPQLRPLHGASDRWLFSQILPPNQRSALFALQSSSAQRYPEDLAIRFFYLNVGNKSQPALARVEIPRWVAQDQQSIGALHHALLEQCALLGARPYPYILHRAHETARISTQEREEIKLRLLLEMRNCGFEPESVSGKSSAKLVSGIKGRH
jgi:hypothetical protein